MAVADGATATTVPVSVKLGIASKVTATRCLRVILAASDSWNGPTAWNPLRLDSTRNCEPPGRVAAAPVPAAPAEADPGSAARRPGGSAGGAPLGEGEA